MERETDFYEKQSQGTSVFIIGLGGAIAFFFSLGAMIGAMITMYSAVANRGREIGTLRALGFGKLTIMFSFLLESVMLSLLGGAAGRARAARTRVRRALLHHQLPGLERDGVPLRAHARHRAWIAWPSPASWA